jgi:hypothetical protein
VADLVGFVELQGLHHTHCKIEEARFDFAK